MLLKPRAGNDQAIALAQRLGCTLSEAGQSFGHARPAVGGAPTAVGAQLKKLGGRWDSKNRVITFMTWPQLLAALQAVVDTTPGE